MESECDFRARGNAAFARGETDLALAHYGGALHCGDPSEWHLVHSNRSLIYLKSRLPSIALPEAEACVRLRPDWGKGYSRVAAALLALGHPEKAEQVLQTGLAVLAAAAAPEPGTVEALTKQLTEAKAVSAAAAALADHYNCHRCSAVVPGSRAFHCSKCLKAVYCGAACQAAAWRTTHKHACKLLRVVPQRPRTPVKSWPPLPRAEEMSVEGISQTILQLRSKYSVLYRPSPDSAKEQSLRLLQAVRESKPLEHIERLLATYPTTPTSLVDASTSLASAVAYGRLDVVRLLLACGASVNIPATDFYSVAPRQAVGYGTGLAVHNACFYPNPTILRALLEAGGDPNMHYEPLFLPSEQRLYPTPLMQCGAGFGGNDGKDAARLECAELLLRAGADLERECAGGRTLRCLCEGGERVLPLLLLLLRAGACPDAASHYPGVGPCIMSCIRSSPARLGLLAALLEHGASVAVWPLLYTTAPAPSPSSQVHLNMSPLAYLCSLRVSEAQQADRASAVRMLLEAGMCASSAAQPGSLHDQPTPLMRACSSRAPVEVVRLLLAHGAHPDSPSVSCVLKDSPLNLLLDMGSGGAPGTAMALISAGAALGPELLAQLGQAVRFCSSGVVEALLRAGADVHSTASVATAAGPQGVPSPTALRPLQLGILRGDRAVLQCLLSAGAGCEARGAPALEPGSLERLVRANALEAGAVALLLAHPDTQRSALAQLADISTCKQQRSLLHWAARKGHGAGVLELLAAGVSATAGDARGVLPLAELLGAGGKARNRAAPRREEYKKAVAALRVAASTAGGSTPLDPDSDGELRISG